MASYRRDGSSSRAHTKKNRRNRPGQTRGYHQDQDQVNSHCGAPATITRLTTMMVSHLRPPLMLPRSLPECAEGLTTTRAETRMRVNQVPSAPEIDRSTTVRHTRPARRQHCKGHLRLFHEMLVHLLPACPITQRKLPLFRAHGHLSRLSHIFMVQYRRREPASPTRFPSIRV